MAGALRAPTVRAADRMRRSSYSRRRAMLPNGRRRSPRRAIWANRSTWTICCAWWRSTRADSCLAVSRRQRDDETTAAVGRKLRPDPPIVHVNDLPSDVQTESEAAEVPLAMRLVEPVEQVVAPLQRNA